MKDITFYTVMGGSDHFYDATKLAVESIHKILPSSKIKVFDFGGKFENKCSETIDCRGQQNTSKKDIGYLYWREKYVRALEIDTEYAVYFDCDTVLINDFFEDIFDIIGDKAGSAQHWWVPTFNDYCSMATPIEHREVFIETLSNLGASLNNSYYAGGVFLFKNTTNNRKLLEKVVKSYDDFNDIYDGEITALTDEFFFSSVFKDNIVNLGGSLNVCPKGNKVSMDLEIDDGILVGKNVFDEDYNPVIFVHCNFHKHHMVHGNDPLDVDYSKEVLKIISEAYQL
jgi:hypothetical protein